MLQIPFQSYVYSWASACLPIAFFSSLIVWSSWCALGPVMALIWMQFVVYLVHQSEEHFWPGGFKAFINKKIFHSSAPNSPLSDLDVFFINIPVIWILFPLAAIVAQHIDLAVGSFLPVFGMCNAATHVMVGIVKRCYNPGLVVSLLLNFPTGFYTIKTMLDAGCVTHTILMVMLLISVAIHGAMVAFALMRCRSQKGEVL